MDKKECISWRYFFFYFIGEQDYLNFDEVQGPNNDL